MIYTRVTDLELCKKHNITPNHLLMIKLYVDDPSVTEEKTADAEFMKNLYAFSKIFGWDMTKQRLSKEEVEAKDKFLVEIVGELIDKEILVQPETPVRYKASLDTFEINFDFLQDFTVNVHEMPEELFEAYPSLFGNNYPARGVTVEQFGVKYLKHINNDRKKHEEIIELVLWAKENKKIMFKLETFVNTKGWESLEELREEGGSIGFSAELV